MAPVATIGWHPSYRLVPSRYPPVGLFDRVADPLDLELVFALEGLTNPRLREEAGDISLVPGPDRVAGPGTTPIMSAFTHLNPEGSRFSDGTYGVYYAAHDGETAMAEVAYHRGRFLHQNRIPALEINLRMYHADITGEFTDIRPLVHRHPEWYHAEDYSASRVLGAAIRAEGSNGIAYMSVRQGGGECVAVFRPPAISPARQGTHYTLVWDGERVIGHYEKRAWHART